MIISHSKKYIFFKPVKTAGTSVEYSLSKSISPIDLWTGITHPPDREGLSPQEYMMRRNSIGKRCIFYEHTSPAQLNTISTTLNACWKDYKKITMIRNPYDLLVSYYWWIYDKNEDELMPLPADSMNQIAEKFEKKIESVCCFRTDDEIPEYNLQCVDWLSQKTLKFCDDNIDFFIRYENLNEDFKHVCSMIDVESVELLRFKSKVRKRNEPYQEYYTPYSKILVKKYFGEIISRFGYEF